MGKSILCACAYLTTLAFTIFLFSCNPVDANFYTNPNLPNENFANLNAIRFRDYFFYGSAFGVLAGYIFSSSYLKGIARANMAAWAGLLASLAYYELFLFLLG